MPASAIVVLLAAICAAAAAVLLAFGGRREQQRVRVLKHLPPRPGRIGEPAGRTASEPPLPLRQIYALFGRAGLQPAAWQAWLLLLSVAVLGAVGFVIFSVPGALLMPLAAVGALYAWLSMVGARQRRLIVEQLPMFLEHVIRALRAGNSVEQSLVAALEESDMPIRGVFERVVRQVQLGVHLDEAVEQAAVTYRLHELELLQMAINVSLRYGGGVREILESVITLVRQRQQARRELKAMTGETRLSALILSVLPIGLALYIVFTNPEYFQHMWQEESGRYILFGAAGLQAFGAFLLWRMVRII